MDLIVFKEIFKLVCMKQFLLLIDVLKFIDGNGDLVLGNMFVVLSWCICNSCREMFIEREKVCCGKIFDNCYLKLVVSFYF